VHGGDAKNWIPLLTKINVLAPEEIDAVAKKVED
jgi:hypothetical protein